MPRDFNFQTAPTFGRVEIRGFLRRVPEPYTLALLGLGPAGIGFSRRKQQSILLGRQLRSVGLFAGDGKWPVQLLIDAMRTLGGLRNGRISLRRLTAVGRHRQFQGSESSLRRGVAGLS
jgi:hypothetical protein